MNTAPQLSTLGKYRLIATIGHGGMAHIHLASLAGPPAPTAAPAGARAPTAVSTPRAKAPTTAPVAT